MARRVQKLLLIVCILYSKYVVYSQPSNDIRCNQVGFYPHMPKIGIVLGKRVAPFFVIRGNDTIYTGMLQPCRYWRYSDEYVCVANFSRVQETGKYILYIPGVGYSSVVEIRNNIFSELARTSLKAFFFQRASMPLEALYAGKWARPSGHPDTLVLIHPSAATLHRPAGCSISSPGGWYDAGDYNKYIVNSGISTYTLLASYEHFPEYCSTLTLNIPESNNTLPDILDEALWNIRWMLTMQDPYDGGIYHKLTNEHFGGFTMPHYATAPRYVVKKTTAASLNFAAVMAQMARIAKQFSNELPGLADTCLRAALRAWCWARIHSNVFYDQKELNSRYDPDIFTGEYGDGKVEDEFAWAAAELFVTTGRDSFLTVANPLSFGKATVPAWPEVHTLGLYTFAHFRQRIALVVDSNTVIQQLCLLADSLVASKNESAYDVVMGANDNDFGWGSNAIAANQGMFLLIVYEITKNPLYLEAALSNLDYLLGRNPLNFCFVTGFGVRSPRNIHHRIIGSDGVDEPFPGLLVGGPNPKREDRLSYPSALPALAYLDDERSFASNEICINWNAPLVYVTIALESLVKTVKTN
ncbi:MAG: glycoside hydrolase family 9 protein [Bacteroidetes bacterium]|nr:glycoside hydrolase family 9 protein [Bacteroidota bacterium]